MTRLQSSSVSSSVAASVGRLPKEDRARALTACQPVPAVPLSLDPPARQV